MQSTEKMSALVSNIYGNNLKEKYTRKIAQSMDGLERKPGLKSRYGR